MPTAKKFSTVRVKSKPTVAASASKRVGATKKSVAPTAAPPKKSASRAGKPAAAKPFASTHPPKFRSPGTLALIDRLRAVCLALPHATEQAAWAEPAWRIGGKIFAICDTYHHGSEHLSVHLPAPPGAQAALIDAAPARFFRPPYVGGRGWVAIVLDTSPDWDMVASLIATAYDLIATVSVRKKSAG
jgi:predicted DNA-binding protein (MmcQ/YjbR family)